MRIMRPALLVLLCMIFSASLVAQQYSSTASTASTVTTASDPQAVNLADRASAVLSGETTVGDVTLTGTARRIAGSDDETGTATLKALSTGESQLAFDFPSGRRSEVRTNFSSGAPSGIWSGPNGVSHQISNHNLMTDSTWFFPAFTVGKLASSHSQGYVVSYIGQETREGQPVVHLEAIQKSSSSNPRFLRLVRRLSQQDFYLDATTFLPVAIAFNTHPQNDVQLNIPVEVRFSDYRAVNGVQVPFHVQKYLNNNLILDLQFQTVILNSGLNASNFAIQ